MCTQAVLGKVNVHFSVHNSVCEVPAFVNAVSVPKVTSVSLSV